MQTKVSVDLGVNGGGEKSDGANMQKVDTSASNAEEKQLQDEVANAMNNNQDLPESPELEPDKNDNSAEEKSSDDGKSQDDIFENNEEGYLNNVTDEEEKEDIRDEEEKEKEEEKITEQVKEKTLDEVLEEKKKEWEKEWMDKYQPNEQKGENIRLNQENEELKFYDDVTQYLIKDKESQIYDRFLENNKDLISPESAIKLKKFRDTNDETLLNDPVLKALDTELKYLTPQNPSNPLVDLSQRLEKAANLAFRDKIISLRVKQQQAKDEIERQNREKMVEKGGNKITPSQEKLQYSKKQRYIADQWGIKLK